MTIIHSRYQGGAMVDWLRQWTYDLRIAGSSLIHDGHCGCVLEQDTLSRLLLFTQVHKWVHVHGAWKNEG